MEGWIKLHRKFIKWEWFNDLNTSHIFLYLLLSANSKDGRWKGIEVKRGQLIAGLSTISKHTGLTIRQARTSLDHLKTTHEIAIKSTNKYSIITICKYDSYQDKDNIDRQAKRQAGSLLSDKQTTSKRQQTRSKEGKEGEEEKNTRTRDFSIAKKLYPTIA